MTMPVILPDDATPTWLNSEDLAADVAQTILRPYPTNLMQAQSASIRVNNARYDNPDVLTDDDPIQGTLL
jgi:putative SOS response-associated peptidase YedK